MQLLPAMAVFALVASISPGPVNLLALGLGARAGIAAGQAHVLGATAGFLGLLALVGLGLHPLLADAPGVAPLLRWGGVGFLLYLAWKLLSDAGRLAEGPPARASFWQGAAMQWLNPKAWLAATAGVGLFVGSSLAALGQFVAVYALICYPSLLCWLVAGALLRGRLQAPGRLRLLNRSLAALLLASAAYLALSP